MTKPVILTGLRANNDLTIGNYFGAILPMIDMAKQKSAEYQINMFIPDLHSFTTPVDHSLLYDQILHNARLFVAAGLPLDNPNIYLYRQSHISAHSELTWILDCFTGFGEMSRMTQFKDKSGTVGADRTSVGLFNYPVLMAADILLYNAAYVPVGDDQSQHIEFTRDIGERINSRFGDVFELPVAVKEQHEFFGKDQGLRIKDLQEPTKKMSKSDESGRGVIFLGDDPKVAAKKVMSATTDDKAEIHFDRENQPGISNLLEILALLRGKSLQETTTEFEGQTRYGDFKAVVAEEVERFLTDFQSRLAGIDDAEILAKLTTSEHQLTDTANATLLRAQQAVGLRPKA
jgi:tryptophanyl-tRNA synthetase